MALAHLFLVALIQGITEFLPVSSSGHLVLVPVLTGYPDQGQAIDVAVHLGTLLAVVIFFWRDVSMGLAGIPRMMTGRIDTPGAKLAFLLMVATVPAVLFGLMLKMTGLDDAMRSIKVIAWTMLGFGIVLYVVDQRGGSQGRWRLESEGRADHGAVAGGGADPRLVTVGGDHYGCAGIGVRAIRRGETGHAYVDPDHFCLGCVAGAEVAAEANVELAKDGAIAAALSFLAALLALSLMMRLLRSVSFTPYVIYRVVLGVGLLAIAYS